MKTSTDELLAFVTVVDTGSITAAAEQLNQTVSGVSRALGRLEKKLDAALLQRTTRRLSLTDEGELFLARARSILQAVDDAEEMIALRRQKPAGRLRVDAASPFMLHCIAPYMAEFHALYPGIKLELTSHDRIIDLLEKHTDIAIRIGTLQDSTLHARALGSSPLHILASPDYLLRRGEPHNLHELLQHPLLGFTDPESLNRWPLHDSNGELVKIMPTMSASSGETLRQLVLSGCGVACLSNFMVKDDIREGRLIPLLTQVLIPQRQTINAVYYHNVSLAGRIRCFLDFMSERLQGGSD